MTPLEPSKRRKKENRTIVVLLLGVAGFLYQMQDLLRHHTGGSMDYYTTPVGVGDILFALLSGVVMMLAALGVNIETLIGIFKGDRK